MVYLNRIYTKTGDDGTTGLGNGTRISKTHPRIVAYGSVDELNSVLGVVLTVPLPGPMAAQLREIQNDLFDVGADLCMPEPERSEADEDDDFEDDEPEEPAARPPLRVTINQVERVENWIDAATEKLQPLRSFVLPGGSPASAHLHHARTVCRRVEINVLHLAEFEDVNTHVNIYLNRLSDLLFVLARVCNENGVKDVLWVPGQNRGDTA